MAAKDVKFGTDARAKMQHLAPKGVMLSSSAASARRAQRKTVLVSPKKSNWRIVTRTSAR